MQQLSTRLFHCRNVNYIAARRAAENRLLWMEARQSTVFNHNDSAAVGPVLQQQQQRPCHPTRTKIATKSRLRCSRFLSYLPKDIQQEEDKKNDLATTDSDPIHWRDCFPYPAEYVDPWSSSATSFSDATSSSSTTTLTTVLPSISPSSLDVSTRFLLELLQDFYTKGTVDGNHNRATTERCLVALKQLLQQQTKERNETEKRQNSMALLMRADAILQAMQLFYHIPQLKRRVPFALPRPNLETYNTVIQLFVQAPSTHSIRFPHRLHAIVQGMEERYREQGAIDLRPTPFHWNSVLLSFLHCDEEDAALSLEVPIEAAKVFLKFFQKEGEADPSSYVHFMRLCMKHAGRGENAGLLAAQVAIKVWQETIEKMDAEQTDLTGNLNARVINQLPSHFYAHFLQAIRPLPVSSEWRQPYFRAGLQRAINFGKVNAVVLQEVMVHGKSAALWHEFFGPYQKQIQHLNPRKAAQRLFELVPKDWTRHADARTL